MPRDDGLRLTMYTAERQPHHVCASHAHSMRSTSNEGVGVGIDSDGQLVSDRDDFTPSDA